MTSCIFGKKNCFKKSKTDEAEVSNTTWRMKDMEKMQSLAEEDLQESVFKPNWTIPLPTPPSMEEPGHEIYPPIPALDNELSIEERQYNDLRSARMAEMLEDLKLKYETEAR